MKTKKICMKNKEFVDEHENLVDVLESESHSDDKVEAKKQKKELDEVKKSEPTLYHIHKDGKRITDNPITLRQINEDHGGTKKLQDSGHVVMDVEDSNSLAKEDKTRLEVTADGKVSYDYGQEDLNKDPQGGEEAQAQSANQDAQNDYDLTNKWKNLKKAMADEAFMEMSSEDGGDESEEEQPEEQPEEQEEEQPEEQPEEQDPNELEMSDEEHGHLQDALPEGSQPEEEHGEEEPPQREEQPEPQEGDGNAVPLEELEEMMRELGHSEAEIAHVIHGHHYADIDELQSEKAETERGKREGELGIKQLEMQIKQMEAALKDGHGRKLNDLDANHKERMLDMEHNHAQKMKEVEHRKALRDHDADDDTQHKANMREIEHRKAEKDIPGDKFDDHKHQQRMMDLEYERAQREMELDLEIKKQQSELKMKQMKVDAVQKGKDKATASKEKKAEKDKLK